MKELLVRTMKVTEDAMTSKDVMIDALAVWFDEQINFLVNDIVREQTVEDFVGRLRELNDEDLEFMYNEHIGG